MYLPVLFMRSESRVITRCGESAASHRPSCDRKEDAK